MLPLSRCGVLDTLTFSACWVVVSSSVFSRVWAPVGLTKFLISDAPHRKARTNVSCAPNPDGAPPDVSRNSSLLVPPPPSVKICIAATHRRPCKRSISNGSCQLHRGRRCRPPWRFAPISLEAPASDWRLGTSWGCSAHVALAPRKLPPALNAPTQGLASILVVRYSVTAPPWGCAVLPVCGRR